MALLRKSRPATVEKKPDPTWVGKKLDAIRERIYVKEQELSPKATENDKDGSAKKASKLGKVGTFLRRKGCAPKSEKVIHELPTLPEPNLKTSSPVVEEPKSASTQSHPDHPVVADDESLESINAYLDECAGSSDPALSLKTPRRAVGNKFPDLASQGIQVCDFAFEQSAEALTGFIASQSPAGVSEYRPLYTKYELNRRIRLAMDRKTKEHQDEMAKLEKALIDKADLKITTSKQEEALREASLRAEMAKKDAICNKLGQYWHVRLQDQAAKLKTAIEQIEFHMNAAARLKEKADGFQGSLDNAMAATVEKFEFYVNLKNDLLIQIRLDKVKFVEDQDKLLTHIDKLNSDLRDSQVLINAQAAKLATTEATLDSNVEEAQAVIDAQAAEHATTEAALESHLKKAQAVINAQAAELAAHEAANAGRSFWGLPRTPANYNNSALPRTSSMFDQSTSSSSSARQASSTTNTSDGASATGSSGQGPMRRFPESQANPMNFPQGTYGSAYSQPYTPSRDPQQGPNVRFAGPQGNNYMFGAGNNGNVQQSPQAAQTTSSAETYEEAQEPEQAQAFPSAENNEAESQEPEQAEKPKKESKFKTFWEKYPGNGKGPTSGPFSKDNIR